jgi:ADP-L-glycero-D-manno-heptose 6-epimerase
MILVTGAFGFIGSNFVRYLNSQGHDNIVVADYLSNGKQFSMLNGAVYTEFISPDTVLRDFAQYGFTSIYHFGAVSSTTEWNGDLIVPRNITYTTDLLKLALNSAVDFSYSSSASVYGNGTGPLNLYAFSKKVIDDFVTPLLPIVSSVLQGFRYFNVYGPGEAHKTNQASPYYQFEQQAAETGEIKVFAGSENYFRDFVHVDTVCRIQYMMMNRKCNGIYDLGTGTQKSFLTVAHEIAAVTGARVTTIPFPEYLKPYYQTNTLADMKYL